MTHSTLKDMLDYGAEIHSTKLTENYTYTSWKRQHGHFAVPLFAIDPRKNLRLFSLDKLFEPGAGWQIYSMVLPDTHAA